MKRLILNSRLKWVSVFFVISSHLFAYDIEVENADGVTIYYNYINNETELQVTYYSSSYSSYSGSVNIPESVTYMNRTRKVTSIGNNAFYWCTGLASITIPGSVKSIGYEAFYRCTHLTSITIPNSVTSIGEHAFWGCEGLASVTIPKSVTSIGDNAFQLCTRLTSITIPNSVTSIGNSVFNGCSRLTSVTIPNSVTRIGNYAFSECSGLTSITIPGRMKSIGCNAFDGCSGLTSIMIPNSVTSIGDDAFRGCSGLTSITIPNSVTSIGNFAFLFCVGLTSINVEEGNTKYDSRENCNAIIETSSSTLIAGCKNSTIPNSVTSIGDNAFRGCSGLTSITIPNSVTSIGNSVFMDCSGLTSITIPNSVTSIGNYAFSECSGLTSITIGSGITRLNYSAFAKCPELTDVTCMAESVPNTDSDAFVDSPINNATLHVSETAIDAYKTTDPWCGFGKLVALTGEEIADPVEIDGILYYLDSKSRMAEVTKNTFGQYSGSIAIPLKVTYDGTEYSVTSIGDRAFYGCTDLTSVTIPHSVTSIGYLAFYKCIRLTSVTIPNSVTSIGQSVFYECSGLTSITFGDSVTSIGLDVLAECKDLAAIVWNPEVAFNENVSNPNLLLFVKDRSYAPDEIQNVIVNGVADEIILQDAEGGNNFYCPQAFTAKSITYEHNYSMKSGYNACQGWETLVLPFDVTQIRRQGGAELVPYNAWTVGSSQRPFWLYSLTELGWKKESTIAANTPYIIGMPNNENYSETFNISGVVLFIGKDVQVKASNNLNVGMKGNKKFVPNYQNQQVDATIYALNVNNQWCQNTVSEVEGSVFIQSLRPVRPFEAYLTVNGSEAARRVIPIFEEGESTGIIDMPLRDDINVDTWFTLDGRKLFTKPTEKGVYINNGKKVMVK